MLYWNNLLARIPPILLILGFISHSNGATLNLTGGYAPPYLYEENGVAIGIDVEIIKHILDNLNIKYKITVLPRVRMTAYLKSGKADIGIGLSKDKIDTSHLFYPKTYTRNAEYVLFAHEETKAKYEATSIDYIKKQNFKVGVIPGDSYHERFWEVFPWLDRSKGKYHQSLAPVPYIASGLKMVYYKRLGVLPIEKLVGLHIIEKLDLNNVSPYDFIIFYKPIFNVFSKNSSFKTIKYPNIHTLMEAYDKELDSFKEQPKYFKISIANNHSSKTKQDTHSSTIKIKNTIKTGKPINIGFLAALTGPSAGWGKPGLTGVQLFINQVNKKGGLLIGSTRHPLKLHIFNDEDNSTKALQGAKELIEKYNVKFINGIGGVSADAIHPYLTEKKVIYASLIATDIKPDRPYLLAGGDVTPRIDMLRPWYHKNKNPTLKRWAVVSQNDPIGQYNQAWEVGAAIAEGWTVVYDKHFSTDTSDFSEIVSDILATKPNVISLNLTWPEFVTKILKQLHIQGYKGDLSANYLDVNANLKVVPKSFHEGAVDSFPLFNDPFWGEPSIQYDFYTSWMREFGPGAPHDVKREITGIDWDHVIMLKVWAYGAQLAESIDPDKIIQALRSQDYFPTMLGHAKMIGKSMWGIQNMVSPPIPINETINGVKRIQIIKRFEDWFRTNEKKIIQVVKSKGFYWKQ